jgi:hypothetical protein
VKFAITQTFELPSDAVIEAYRLERTWHSFRGLPFVGDANLCDFVAGDPTHIETRYHVSVNVAPAARRFIDPDKLSFIEVSRLASDGSGTFEIVPDHYGALIRSSGITRVEPIDDATCIRLMEGVVDVSLGLAGMLFERPVEEAVVRGLRDALFAQAEQIRLE